MKWFRLQSIKTPKHRPNDILAELELKSKRYSLSKKNFF